MKSIKLPTYPTDLPETSEVRDFDLENGLFARVIMSLSKIVMDGPGEKVEHWAITAQCYEMNADGTFRQAPNGFPSRSNSTTSTMPASALGQSLKIDDGWVRVPMTVDVSDPPAGVELVDVDPTDDDVVTYGTIRHNQVLARTWQFVQGWADIVAATKIEDLLRVLSSESVHSGMGFRKKG